MPSDTIRFYGNMVWTDHVLNRLKRRSIPQSDALAVLRHPDKTFPGQKDGSVKFIRTINGRPIHVVASLNERQQWVVMSAWVRGESDPPPILLSLLISLYRAIKTLFYRNRLRH